MVRPLRTATSQYEADPLPFEFAKGHEAFTPPCERLNEMLVVVKIGFLSGEYQSLALRMDLEDTSKHGILTPKISVSGCEAVLSFDPSTGCSTIVDLLRFRASSRPLSRSHTFLRDGVREQNHLTYGELEMYARAIAARLQGMSSPGDRALLLYSPGLDFVASFLGCLYAAIVAIPAYPPRSNQGPGRVQEIIQDACPSVILTTSDRLSKVNEMLEDSAPFRGWSILATDESSFRSGPSLEQSEKDWRDSSSQIGAGTPAYLQYTSGSTSEPKGVIVTHGNLLTNLRDMDLGWEHDADSVLVSWLPHFHDMGLIYGILGPLYAGIPGYLMSPLSFIQRPVRWLEAITHFRATHSVAPNFAYELCAKKVAPEARNNLDLANWAVAVSGAEPVREETMERFARFFEPCGFRRSAFCPGYGLAEATLKVTATRRGEAPALIHLSKQELEGHRAVKCDAGGQSRDTVTLVGCGRSMVGTEVAIVHPERRTRCLPLEVGEIWVSGPTVADGYWNRTEETAVTFRAVISDTGEGPFLRTGDLGFLSGDHLFVTGRLKDMIIIRGQNHYPQDIERTVERSHPALREPGFSAAFSLDVAGEERLVVVAEVDRRFLAQASEEWVGTIRQAISETHEIQAYDVVLAHPGNVPKTSSGKIQRRASKAAYLARELEVVEIMKEARSNES